MTSKIFSLYYREQGARYPDALTREPDFILTAFPRESIFHVYDDGDGSPDIDTSKPYYKGLTRRIATEFVFHYAKPQGPVREWTFNYITAIQPWKRAHLQTWQIEDDLAKARLTPDQLAVVNYGYIDKSYKYQTGIGIPYYKWLNRVTTIYSRMNELAKATNRQQFLIVKVPRTLQGRTILDRFIDKPFTVAMQNIFGEPEIDGFFQLDLWRWLSDQHRKLSLMSTFDAENLKKINFVFEGVTGKQMLVNLGYLDSWVKGHGNSTDLSNMTQFPSEMIQKFTLKLFMSLNAVLAEEPIEEAVTSQRMELPDSTADDEEEFGDGRAEVHEDSEVSVSQAKQSNPLNLKDLNKETRDAPVDLNESLIENIESDLKALDTISLVQVKNKGLVKELTSKTQPVEEVVAPEETVDPEQAMAVLMKKQSPSEILMSQLSENAEASLITAAEYRRMSEAVKSFNSSEDPYGSGKPRQVAAEIKPEDKDLTAEDNEIPVTDAVPDKTMAESSHNQYNRKYLERVYQKDVLNVVNRLQAAGVIVQKHEVHRATSILGTYEYHRLELKPIDGQPSTIKFSLPVINEDGTYEVAGNKYLARKQRVDLPIRKIGPSIVGLSTYYGKTFVQINPKVANSSLAWIIRRINLAIITDGSYIHSVSLGDVFDNEFKAPFIYNALSNEFESFFAGDNELFFNHRTRHTRIDPDKLKALEKQSRIFCGFSAKKNPIVVDATNHFHEVIDGQDHSLGDVYQLLKLEKAEAPVDFSEVRVFSKYIPVGVVLGYYIGFKKLLAALNVKYRTVEPRKNKQLAPNEYAIVFKDKSYIFNRDNRFASLIISGFAEFEKTTKYHDSTLFDYKDVYLNMLMSKGYTSIYIRELDMMENAFVDHISEEILQSMNEPTTFKGLLYRATELLQTYHHPVSQDRTVMRERGYERFAGAVYKELTVAIRQFRNKNIIGRSKIDISPFQVWNSIMKDSTIKIVEDINPIQNLKETEVITYAGAGGRDKDTMTKPTRAYHHSAVGVDSESTVDNVGVGTVVYLTANPNIKDVRGVMSNEKKLNPTSMMSTASLISPCSFNDNAKRIMFINTQHSHTIAADGYVQPYIRTGYEKVIAKRTTSLFSTAALEDGVVESVTDKALVVKYASGKVMSVLLGRQYGKAEGSVYPHDIVPKVSQGQKFKKGAILAYNEKFFEPDFLDPNEVNMKISGYATIAFLEDKSTHEDSSTISPKLGARFKTEVTKIKSYVVRFEQGIQNIVKVGDQVQPRDALMIIEDEVTAAGQFSGDSIETLKRLANAAPRAGMSGTVERIEVLYHGEKRDMTPTLKKIADKSDQDIAAICKAQGKQILNGHVSDEYRVSGVPLGLDQAEIRIYITVKASTGVGDKAVFGHQMKSTIAEVHPGEIFTEGGTEVDAIFSYRSVAGREVNSATLMGSATVLLDLAAQRALNAYFGDKK